MRLRFGLGVMCLLAGGCAEQPLPMESLGPRGRAGASALAVSQTSALTSSLSSTASYSWEVIPGMYRVNAVNDAEVVVGDDGGNNVATAWSRSQGTITVGFLSGASGISSLNDINSSGEAVGWSTNPTGTGVMRWSVSTNMKFDPVVPGATFGQGINDAGDIVGGQWPFFAFYLPAGGTPVHLPTAPGITGPYAFDINLNGAIVGDGFVGGSMQPVYWPTPSSIPIALGTLGGTLGRAWQVSDGNEIVGWASTSAGVKHAFLWTATTGMIDLSAWPNSCTGDSEAYAINRLGVIAGRCEGKPVLWTATEGMRVLPTPYEGGGEAMDINNLNQVVGHSALGVLIWTIVNMPPTPNAGGPYAASEGSTVQFSGSGSSDPENQALSYVWNFGDPEVSGGGTSTSANPVHSYSQDGTFDASLTVSDGNRSTSTTARVTISNVAPQMTSLNGQVAPVSVGTSVEVSSSFVDAGVMDTHTATVDWDAAGATTQTSAAVISELAGTGSFVAHHTYFQPGVYTVQASLSDDAGATTGGKYQYVVVYDVTAGFVTGGGWIDSPPGAYRPNTSASGKANFGFVSRYQKGKTVPAGQTQFQFRAGGIDFQSDNYDWLVIAGKKAQYKGIGTVNGSGSFGFLLTAWDGDAKGDPEPDQIRVKIWDKATGAVVYDNQFGDADDSNPTTVLGGGSIVIHP